MIDISKLSDNIQPLAWEKAPDWKDCDICSRCGVYQICEGQLLFLPDSEVGDLFDTLEAAKAAANAHHRTRIMAAFGVQS